MLLKRIFFYFLFSAGNVCAESVVIPIKISYPLLQRLVIMQLFQEENDSAELSNDSLACTSVRLTEPKFSENQQKLQIHIKVDAQLSMDVFGQCINFLNWTGHTSIITQPVLNAQKPVIHLQVTESQLFNDNGEILTSGQIWDFFKQQIHPFLSRFQLDLTPSIHELKALLPLILPNHTKAQVNSMLDSLRLSNMVVANTEIKTDLILNIDKTTNIDHPEKKLSEKELQQLRLKWQSMDAFLTDIIKYYAAATDLTDLRSALLDVLIDARHTLYNAVSKDHQEESIRRWFIDSWSQITPLASQIAFNNPKFQTLNLMTLMSGANVLTALDQLGPSFGLDISVDGLRRLARLVNQSPTINPLNYSQEIDPELLKLMPQSNDQSQLNINFWPVRSAHAASNSKLNGWIPTQDEYDLYLSEIKQLLTSEAKKSLKPGTLSTSHQTIFQKIVLATGLQESCWRQYVVENKKVVPIRSSTGDTGIMQVNENVWRGFVDVQKLRWDISYNANTGAGILLKYLNNSALKHSEHQRNGGLDNLAYSTYSAYNGGPGQYARYRNNKTNIDKAFQKKFIAVKNDKERSIAECFNKNPRQSSHRSQVKTKHQFKTVSTVKPKPMAKTQSIPLTQITRRRIANTSWVMQRKKTSFTLQLGVFSTEKAAQSFIQTIYHPGTLAIYRYWKNGKNNYGVLYGEYSSRQAADLEKQGIQEVKAWTRSFNDIQKLIRP